MYGVIQPSPRRSRVAACAPAFEAAFVQPGRPLALFDETPVFSRTLRRTLRPARRAMLPLGHDRHLPRWVNVRFV